MFIYLCINQGRLRPIEAKQNIRSTKPGGYDEQKKQYLACMDRWRLLLSCMYLLTIRPSKWVFGGYG